MNFKYRFLNFELRRLRQNFSSLGIFILVLLGLTLTSGCDKKNPDQPQLQKSSSSSENAFHPRATTSQIIDPNGTQVAQNWAETQGLQFEWSESIPPTLEDENGDLIVTNVFEIDGEFYDIPTFHPSTSFGERPGVSQVFQHFDLDIYTDSHCLTEDCLEYVLSVIVARDQQALLQNLVSIDFTRQRKSAYRVNGAQNLKTLKEFVEELYAY